MGIQRVTQETIIESPVTQLIAQKEFTKKAVSGSTTIDVTNIKNITCGGTAVTVTEFKNGQNGQRIYLLGDGATTIQNNAKIKTNTAADKLLATDKVYRFTMFNSVWYEDE